MQLSKMSLAAKFGLGAGLIGILALCASVLTVLSASRISDRVDASLAAEARIAQYSALSTQVTSMAVLVLEAGQSVTRVVGTDDQLERYLDQIAQSFDILSRSLGLRVDAAVDLGLDEQSKRATESIILARMEAVFDRFSDTVRQSDGLNALRPHLSNFSNNFLPLLGDAVAEQQRIRDQAFVDIDLIRTRSDRLAAMFAIAAVGLVAAYVFLLVRPQLGRLNEIIDEQTVELRAANDSLARTDERRRRFFADISHEMRTPLTVISMEAELGAKAADAASEPFEIIGSRARLLSRRIDDLLRIARSETGRLDVEQQRFDLADAAAGVVAEATKAATRAGLELRVQSGGPVEVLGDVNWTRQVISALLENAIRHAGHGTTVRVEIASINDFGRVWIVDDGIGIPADQIDAVMTRFEQGDSRSGDGFGIGLSFAKWVIEAQSGRMAMMSPPEGYETGTLVEVELPLNAGENISHE